MQVVYIGTQHPNLVNVKKKIINHLITFKKSIPEKTLTAAISLTHISRILRMCLTPLIFSYNS